MSEAAVGLLVLAAICIACSIVTHMLVRSFWLACALTVISAVPSFQLATFLHSGFLDPFWPIAVVATSFICLVASAVIGAVIRRAREASASR
jgi:hypothetical protein